MKKDKEIIHIEFKRGFEKITPDNCEGKNFYFGTLAAVYEMFTPKEIGAARETIYKNWHDTSIAHETSKCFIRKNYRFVKETKRVAPFYLIKKQK